MYDLNAQKLQKLNGPLGFNKNLANITCSASKYYCIATKQGEMAILSQDQKLPLFDLKMNGSCTAVAFSGDERFMYSVGDQAEIYQWDLNMRKCVGRVQDTGAFSTTALAISPSGGLLATGSKMGSVNLFNVDHAATLAEAPFKTLLNLTTAITDMGFNHSGELLTFSSQWKKNALKMAHIPSYTVFQNFPGVAPGVLKMAFCGGFSRTSQYYAIGNDEGKCHLFELNHFRK